MQVLNLDQARKNARRHRPVEHAIAHVSASRARRVADGQWSAGVAVARAFGASVASSGPEKPASDDQRESSTRGGIRPHTADWYWGSDWELRVPFRPGGRIPWNPPDRPEEPGDIPPGLPGEVPGDARRPCEATPRGCPTEQPIEACPRPGSAEECASITLPPFEAEPMFQLPWDPRAVPRHVVRVPEDVQRASDDLFLLLHGKYGAPLHAGIANVADAIAATCHRVIALQWHADGTTAERCQVVHPLPVSPAAWNQCLERERNQRLSNADHGIEPQLLNLLARLDVERPWEGWGQYFADGQLNWDRIVVAGYSEGANQTAFIRHNRPIPGTMLISGGGDRGTWLAPEELADVVHADWMAPLPANARVVGLYHADEQFGSRFSVGWARHGLISGDPGDALSPGPYYESFVGAQQLERHDAFSGYPQDQTWDLAHASTIERVLRPAHMYLACRAAGKATYGMP